MRSAFFFFVILLCLAGCTPQGDNGTPPGHSDTLSTLASVFPPDTLKYRNVSEVVQNLKGGLWMTRPDDMEGNGLYFDVSTPGLLAVIAAENKLTFPFRIENDTIIVLWARQETTSLDSALAARFSDMDKCCLDKPFMSLSLTNDTTLSACYSPGQAISAISQASPEQELFSKIYLLVCIRM